MLLQMTRTLKGVASHPCDEEREMPSHLWESWQSRETDSQEGLSKRTKQSCRNSGRSEGRIAFAVRVRRNEQTARTQNGRKYAALILASYGRAGFAYDAEHHGLLV